MDKFTRVYALLLGAVLVAGLFFFVRAAWQPDVAALNRVLKADTELADYPYQFRVQSLSDGVATIWSPRSFDVPAMRFLAIIHPELNGVAQDDPRMLAAQQQLIDHQKRAQGLIAAQDGVTRVDWALDARWLADRGVVVPAH